MVSRATVPPCKSKVRSSGIVDGAVTDGSPQTPRSLQTVGVTGAPSVSPSNPNSRLGRKVRSPIRQGRVAMDIIAVGIDVSKDRLDVAVDPDGEAFVVERNGTGLAQLGARLKHVGAPVVGVGAT